MAKPKYSIFIDGKVQSCFDGDSLTYDRSEAEKMFHMMEHDPSISGDCLELVVSSRGFSAVLLSKDLTDQLFVAETEVEPEYKVEGMLPKDDFLDQIRKLHDSGFTYSEIGEITGKSSRVVRYNIKKLADENVLVTRKAGRPITNKNREKYSMTVHFYKDNYEYLMFTFGNISNVVNDLIDEYRRKHEKE